MFTNSRSRSASLRCNYLFVTASRRRRTIPRESEHGFALVACIMLVTLLMVLALGLLSLSTIELRRSTNDQHAAVARANARMAMINAIGQLQENLGPDQRVSATAEILGDGVKQPHWTGVWRTRKADGSSWFTRDDLDGGLRDGRAGSEEKDKALAWLISGKGDPKLDLTGETISLMKPDFAGQALTSTLVLELKVPLL